MTDSLYSGRAFRTLNLIDEGNRQALGIEVAHSIPSLGVIRVMEQLIELYGKPRALRLDNGPEAQPSGRSAHLHIALWGLTRLTVPQRDRSPSSGYMKTSSGYN